MTHAPPDATADLPDPVRRARHALWAALVLILIWGATSACRSRCSMHCRRAASCCALPDHAAGGERAAAAASWHALAEVPRADLLAALKLGIAGHVLHVGLVTFGIHWSTPFSSSLILACGPMFTLLILRWHGIERLSRGQIAGVAAPPVPGADLPVGQAARRALAGQRR